jgi:hypothetical protein
VLARGSLLSWGSNFAAQTSFPPSPGYTVTDAGITSEPSLVTGGGPGEAFVHVSAGLGLTCALRITGEVLCFGANNDGELGVGFSAANRDDAGAGYTAAPTPVGFR